MRGARQPDFTRTKKTFRVNDSAEDARVHPASLRHSSSILRSQLFHILLVYNVPSKGIRQLDCKPFHDEAASLDMLKKLGLESERTHIKAVRASKLPYHGFEAPLTKLEPRDGLSESRLSVLTALCIPFRSGR